MSFVSRAALAPSPFADLDPLNNDFELNGSGADLSKIGVLQRPNHARGLRRTDRVGVVPRDCRVFVTS